MVVSTPVDAASIRQARSLGAATCRRILASRCIGEFHAETAEKKSQTTTHFRLRSYGNQVPPEQRGRLFDLDLDEARVTPCAAKTGNRQIGRLHFTTVNCDCTINASESEHTRVFVDNFTTRSANLILETAVSPRDVRCMLFACIAFYSLHALLMLCFGRQNFYYRGHFEKIRLLLYKAAVARLIVFERFLLIQKMSGNVRNRAHTLSNGCRTSDVT